MNETLSRVDYSKTKLISAICMFVIAVAAGWAASMLPDLTMIGLAVAFLFLIIGGLLYKPARVLFAFMALLPVHQMIMMTLLHFSGSWTLVSLTQPWKEALAVGALVLTAGMWLMAGRWFKWRFIDKLMILYLVFNTAYIFGPWDTGLDVRLFGARANAFFVIFYFLGRIMPLSSHTRKQILSGFLILGALAGVFALIDILILPVDWPARIGLTEYLSRGTGAIRGRMGLSSTFWTASGIRRSSSFFANPLDLAASVHLTGVTALVIAISYPKRSKGRYWASVTLALVVTALLLSVSRTSTIVFILESLLVVILLRRYSFVVLILICVAVIIAIAIYSSPKVIEHIHQTVTFENPSSQGHLQRWKEGINIIVQDPFGLGPGTSGRVGARFGNQVGGESQYIVLGVETGIIGVTLYILVQATAITYAMHLFRNSSDDIKQLALITLVSRIGIALTGITAHIETYLFVAFINWLLVGLVVQHISQAKIDNADLPPIPPTVAN